VRDLEGDAQRALHLRAVADVHVVQRRRAVELVTQGGGHAVSAQRPREPGQADYQGAHADASRAPATSAPSVGPATASRSWWSLSRQPSVRATTPSSSAGWA